MSWRNRVYRAFKTLQDPGFFQWETICTKLEQQAKDPSQRYLADLLEFAQQNVLYYNEIIKEKFHNPESLQGITTLDKEKISKNFEKLKSSDIDVRLTFETHSGGSTGTPQCFLQNKEYSSWALATENFYYRKFLKFDPNLVPKVLLWGARDDLLETKSWKNKVGQSLQQIKFLNSYSMTPKLCHQYVRKINQHRPYYIRGYSHSLFLLAQFIKENHLRIFSPHCIISSAEKMHDFMKKIIEDVFCCPVYDYYGSREVGAIAGECYEGKLHVFSFNNWVEIIDEEGKLARPGEEGKVVITNLHNFSMPLIRYEIGDTAIQGYPCSCESNLPTIEEVSGRTSDHFITSNGKMVSGLFFALICRTEWMKHYQVIQTKTNTIKILYIPKRKLHKSDFEGVANKIRQVMGADCEIIWEVVDSIPLSKNGKLLLTKSLVAPKEYLQSTLPIIDAMQPENSGCEIEVD